MRIIKTQIKARKLFDKLFLLTKIHYIYARYEELERRFIKQCAKTTEEFLESISPQNDIEKLYKEILQKSLDHMLKSSEPDKFIASFELQRKRENTESWWKKQKATQIFQGDVFHLPFLHADVSPLIRAASASKAL